jgi:hypothetical protein
VKEQIIRLEQHDDIASAREKLAWAQATHVLIVFPDTQGDRILQGRLDLLLLQREATRKRAQLALITRDPIVQETARDLGIAVFQSIKDSRRQTWRTARAPLAVNRNDQPTPLNRELVEAGSRLNSTPRPIITQIPPRVRMVAGLAGITLAILFTLIVGPGATIHLTPAAKQVTVTATIIADPNPATPEVALETETIRARSVGIEVEGRAQLNTTGTIEQPTEKARGVALFNNLIPDQVTIPAGTIVRTSAAQPVRFVTLADATLPGTVGATVEVAIEAVNPGFEGNIPSARVNQVEGPLASRVAVTNSQAIRGGDVTVVPAISNDDYARVRSVLLQELQQRAYAEMQTDPLINLTDTEFIPLETLAVVLVQSEIYDNSVGQPAAQITLDMQVTVQGIAIDERLARQIVYAQIAKKVGVGYQITPETLIFRRREVTGYDDQRRVTFVMQGAGDVSASILDARVKELASGRTPDDAAANLVREFPLAGPPTIEMWPPFWPIISPVRARIHVDTGTQ